MNLIIFDCIVVGSGPSGISASIYLKRAGLNVLVLSKNNGSSLEKATIDNYYGYISHNGQTLYENGLKQLKENKIECVMEEVLSINYSSIIEIKTKNFAYYTKRLILALGSPIKLEERFKKYLGLGVSVCAHCDAPFYKNEVINVTGIKPYLDKTIDELSIYSKNINVINYEDINYLKGENNLEAIIMKNGSEISVSNLFISLPFSPIELSNNLGLMIDKNNYIKVNEKYETNIKNIYAIGDMIKGVKQVVKASYDGMMVAFSIIEDIKNEKLSSS